MPKTPSQLDADIAAYLAEPDEHKRLRITPSRESLLKYKPKPGSGWADASGNYKPALYELGNLAAGARFDEKRAKKVAAQQARLRARMARR